MKKIFLILLVSTHSFAQTPMDIIRAKFQNAKVPSVEYLTTNKFDCINYSAAATNPPPTHDISILNYKAVDSQSVQIEHYDDLTELLKKYPDLKKQFPDGKEYLRDHGLILVSNFKELIASSTQYPCPDCTRMPGDEQITIYHAVRQDADGSLMIEFSMLNWEADHSGGPFTLDPISSTAPGTKVEDYSICTKK